MNIFTPLALRLFGLSGMLGALLFIWGDLLYGHLPGSKSSPAHKMSSMSENRLLTSGTLGFFGCWFYSLASLHVYMAFQPAGHTFAFVLWLAFAATMICYGLGHAAYFSIATGAQTAIKLGADPEEGGKLGYAFFKRLTTLIYIPATVFSVMMIYAILTGGSRYPLWMLIFLPFVLHLLKAPVLRILKGHLQELVADSYDNLILFVFFTLSTIILWN